LTAVDAAVVAGAGGAFSSVGAFAPAVADSSVATGEIADGFGAAGVGTARALAATAPPRSMT
jgi:hypothetical protein